MRCLAFLISSQGMPKTLQAKGMVIIFMTALMSNKTTNPTKTRSMAFPSRVTVMGGMVKGKASGDGSFKSPSM